MENKDFFIIGLICVIIFISTCFIYVSNEHRIQEINQTAYNNGRVDGQADVFNEALINGVARLPIFINGTLNTTITLYSQAGCINLCQQLGCQLQIR